MSIYDCQLWRRTRGMGSTPLSSFTPIEDGNQVREGKVTTVYSYFEIQLNLPWQLSNNNKKTFLFFEISNLLFLLLCLSFYWPKGKKNEENLKPKWKKSKVTLRKAIHKRLTLNDLKWRGTYPVVREEVQVALYDKVGYIVIIYNIKREIAA